MQEAAHCGVLRGPGNVDDLAARLAQFIESEKREELERDHVTSFEFPQKYMSHLVGRRGENINKMREEFDVDIQAKDGKVNIIGPKAKADLARSKIVTLGKQMEDEATHVLIIPAQYHRDIIGSKGGQVNHLQDRYNVRIHFPRSSGTGEDQSIPDDVSEISHPRNRRPNQGPNEVIVKGPSRGANAARDELLDLLKWTQDHSHSAVVSVAQKQLPSLIGQGGQEMQALRLTTGAQVDIPRDAANEEGRTHIQIRGTKKQVEEAKKILQQKAQAFDDTIARSVAVDRKHHKNLIGPGGSNIRNIVLSAGGSDDRRELAKTVRFPAPGVDDDTIRVEGTQDVVDKVIAAIEAFALRRDNQTTETVEIAPEKHRLLIGHGGETRRQIESRFDIELGIPRLTDEGPARSQVRLSGFPDNIEKAKAHIQGMVQDTPSETVDVPRKYHHVIADNGHFFRQLKNRNGVSVHHGGHQPPPKPIPASAPGNGGSSMPLITDDPDTAATHSFTIRDGTPISFEEGTLPWILRGTPDNITKARSALEKALQAAEAQQSQTTGYLTLSDPTKYRYVIGQGGSKINEIRRQTGCKINVPKDATSGDAIEIVGSKEGVEEARDIIIEAVSRGGRRG